MALLLGYDVGSSSIKATLMEAETGEVLATATSPDKELEIIAENLGWAEQQPQTWWEHVIKATKSINAQVQKSASCSMADARAIGISYQMHGLVAVDKNKEMLRPSIIWCDSRAVAVGEKAAADIGEEKCLERLLNLPGNFTASKLKWMMENEPDIYSKIHKIMLPGDYIAMKMTGEIKTTPSGLSEGIMWDFQKQGLADLLLDYYGISSEMIAEVVPTFSVQGELTKEAAEELGLKAGTKISYRAGDQPNNALSLNVLNPGEIAATAGTSGVVYGISDSGDYDSKSRVNTFVHVNYSAEQPRYGVLLCLNGTGILNSWLKHNAAGTIDYDAHLLRAAQEGIVFALNYGLGIMRQAGVQAQKVRAGHANMFLSPLFGEAFATVTQSVVELYNTDGSHGAARGAGIGAGIYKGPEDAFAGLKPVKTIEPNEKLASVYQKAYDRWEDILKQQLKV
ncbi:MAG: xylulokinase [Planctomycetota bacterium]|jgi:xylulokinase